MSKRKLTDKEYEDISEQVRQRFFDKFGWTWNSGMDSPEFGNIGKAPFPFLKSAKKE